MSNIRKNKIAIILLSLMLSFFMFGCKKDVGVNDIYFNLQEITQLVLIEGDEMDLSDYVEIKPANATNKKYSLQTFNADVVKIENGVLKAVGEGVTQIKVVSEDNSKREDLMSVVVVKTQTALSAPKNLTYDAETQSFQFDAVPNATSYSLKVNDEIVEIGNTRNFALKELGADGFNKVLKVQVKANAPSYTNAFLSSDYCPTINMYQASDVENVEVVGGNLKFAKGSSALQANVYFDNDIYLQNSSEREFSFVNLNESYAGKNIDVAVELVLNETSKENLTAIYGDVEFYPSNKSFVNVKVLPVPDLDIKTATLYLKNTTNGGEYRIFVDGVLKTTTALDYFDLKSAEIGSEKVHVVEVEPVIREDAKNVFKTKGKNEIKVRQLEKPVLEIGDNGIVWQEVENKSAYAVAINSSQTTTGENQFSMVGYEAGAYTIYVQAMAQDLPDVDGVHYITSVVSELAFSKQGEVAIEVSDYVLKLTDLGTDIAHVEIEGLLDETIVGDGGVKNIDLSKIDFEAGKHEIVVKRLGNSTCVNGNDAIHSFVQLEKIGEIKIENGVVVAERSEINANAGIRLEIQGGTLLEKLVVQNSSLLLNTTDEAKEDFLGAGDYVVNVYVDGNGSTTFAYRENGVVVATTEPINFGVLEVPILSVQDGSKSVFTIGEVANATKYNVFKIVDEEYVPIAEETTETNVNFEVASEISGFAVQAVENETSKVYLSSNISAPVGVIKLEAPTLAFDNSNNVVKKSDVNDPLTVEKYELTKNGTDFSDYDYISSINLTEDTNFVIKAIAKSGKIGNNFYLNSDEETLELIKLNSGANIIINENNQMVILSNETRECGLELVFDFGGTSKVFKGADGVLSDDVTTLNYSYSLQKETSEYVIDLIDDKFNLYVEELINQFTVKVRFSKVADNNNYITSEFSNFETLNLTKLSATTQIAVNENNEITLTPIGHDKQHGIVVVFNDDEDLIFVGNGSKLVCGETELAYSYSNGVYSIKILDEKFNCLVEEITTDFKVKVKYTHDLNGGEADLDSLFSANQTIELLQKATLSREGQNLKINNVKDTYDINNYFLLINNSCKLPLSESGATINAGYLVFDVEYIFSSKEAQGCLKQVNSVEVVTSNEGKESVLPVLANKGEVTHIEKAEAVVLVATKNNDVGNKSLVISFEKTQTDYSKEYIVEISMAGEIKKVIRYDESSAQNIISFNIDDVAELYDLDGEISIVAKVNTSDNYGELNTIEVFNSAISNEIVVEKLAKVTNVAVSNSILTWDSMENAVGYEVYEKTNNDYVKLNGNFLLENSFEFANITGTKDIVIKAISVASGYSNSYYSEAVKVCKIATPTLTVENGKFKVVLPMDLIPLLANESVKIIPETNNVQKGIVTFDLNDVDGKSISFNPLTRTVFMEPYLALAYNSETVMKEDLSFQIRIEQTTAVDGVYYLNSNKANISAYGLKKDVKVWKTANDDKVELIAWQESDKNTLSTINGTQQISVSHIFKMEHLVEDATETYFSNDENLKYYDQQEDAYKSYPTYLSATSIVFPAGYDRDGDGTLDVKFEEGTFKFYLQTIPAMALEGYNLCNSSFTEAYVFDILKKPDLTVVAGEVQWLKQDKASKYIVSVYAGDDATEISTDTLLNDNVSDMIVYGFTNSKLKEKSGVFRVVVKAISNTDDAVNSVESEPLYVYRLHEATDLTIDDGHLILSASKYFSEARFEFVDAKNNVFIGMFNQVEKANENLSLLGLDSWKTFTDVATIDASHKCKINLDAEVLGKLLNTDYTINVTLLGNTSKDMGVISSSKSISLPEKPLHATKLRPNLVEVKKGTLKFVVDSSYATITGEGVYSGLDFNYSFNGETSSDFWHNTAVYRLDLEYSLGKTSIYAVDYYSFMTAFGESIKQGVNKTNEYEIIDVEDLFARVIYPYGDNQTLSFNVFKNNTIDLLSSDNLNYYKMREHAVAGVNNFEMEKEEYHSLDLTKGGSFTFHVYMMGGDSKIDGEISVGHFTAAAYLVKTFNRYSANELSSNGGKIQFANLLPRVNDIVIDNPVYRLVVKEFGNNLDAGKIFYLYHNTEEEARQVAQRFEAETAGTAIYAQVETIEEDELNLLFDLSQYINQGTYSANIQTLAGLGIGVDDSDYLLNGQVSTYNYPVYKLFTTNMVAATGVNDGQLSFEQSYIIVDNGNRYHENYEITIIDEENKASYVYQINRSSEGVKIDDANHVVYYDLPNEILPIGASEPVALSENKVYKIKVRAMARTNVDDNLVINASYDKQESEDKSLMVKKSEGLSSIKISEGVLKWVVKNPETHVKTSICIVGTNDATGEEFTFAEIVLGNDNKVVDDQGNYLYHYYDFTDLKYNYLATGSGEIKDGFTYKISAYVTDEDEEGCCVLNSNKCESITAQRLRKVDEIKTVNGILTWSLIEGATLYEITISGSENHKITTTETMLDLLAENIKLSPSGTYYVQIKAKDETDGDASRINAMNSAVVGAFLKLDKVLNTSIEIDGFKIKWQEVENAQAYNLKLIYGEEQSFEQVGIEATEFSLPQEIHGTITGSYIIQLTAIGTTSEKLFNGEMTQREIDINPPSNVEEFYFDETTQNRFVVKVKTENFKVGDKLVIAYEFEKYLSDPDEQNKVSDGITVGYGEGDYEIKEEYYYYYLPVSVMGYYSNLRVQVTRPNTLPSIVVGANNKDFRLYRYGAGEENDPYCIFSASELLNIKYFSKTKSHFALRQAIDMSGVDINAELNKNNGALIADEFNGYLTGGENWFIYFNPNTSTREERINLENQYTFAMFGKLKNATIDSLTIGQINYELILSNTFAFNLSNVLKLSVIATSAENSTLSNIKITNLKIEISSETDTERTHNGMQISALVSEANAGTTISNSEINMKVNIVDKIISSNSTVSAYVGGVVAVATSADVASCEVTMEVATHKDNTIKYLGGVFASYVGTNKTHGITKTTVNVTSSGNKVLNFGGLVGFARNIKVDECDAVVTYAETGIIHGINIGGLIGYSQNAVISNSGSSVQFNITLASLENVFIGSLVGFLTVEKTTDTSTITNCYNTSFNEQNPVYKTNLLDGAKIELGVYGNAITDRVTLSGIRKNK